MQPQSLKSFFRRRAIAVLIVFLICVLIFVYAMQITSVVVLADSAMRTRVEYAIGADSTMQSESYLSRFFSQDYIDTGALKALQDSYEDCTITSHIQLSSVQWVWTWPWGGSAYVKIHDSVNKLTGDVLSDTTGTQPLPQWPSGVYGLTLKKRGGVWLITDMQLISLDAEQNPATPTPQQTPTLEVTPSAQPAE